MCMTEFFRVTDTPTSEEEIVAEYPEVRRGGRTTSGVLVLPQVMGSEPTLVAETAARLVALGAPGIDLNFGCPVKAVNLKQAGAALLKEPERIEAICLAVRGAIGTTASLSVKTRLGWEDNDGLTELAKRIEGAGVDWLTIHGRTRRDGYRGEADWRGIGLARQAVSIPVVANGDLTRMAQLSACAEQSGCHNFMIGRGVLGRPGLFHQLRGARAPGDEPELLAATLQTYAKALLERGMRERGVVNRVRHWLRLIPLPGRGVARWMGELRPRSGAEELLELLATPACEF
jgi:tRNA-dihydrouridine synthase C